jgi:hypothetical protein
MTPRKEEKEEGILERMLERLKCIGRNVERIMYRYGFYNGPRGWGDDDEWSPEDIYNNENGDY